MASTICPKRRGPVFALLLAVSVLARLAAPASAWDETGHMIVAKIAYDRLSPKARATVDKLAAQIHLRNGTYTRNYNFITLACWMDDFRRARETPGQQSGKGDWHYIDLDCSDTAVPAGGPNVVWALNTYLPKLGTAKTGPESQDEVLGFIEHLVGDIHQPLHCVGKEKAGNGHKIFGVPDLGRGGRQNLHAFWDEAYRYGVDGNEVVAEVRYKDLHGRGATHMHNVNYLAHEIVTAYPPTTLKAEIQITQPSVWAMAGKTLGCQEFPDTLGENLSPAYVAGAKQIAWRQLALAGYRLAKAINNRMGA